MYVCIRIYVCMYACMYIYTYIYTYIGCMLSATNMCDEHVCIHAYIHINICNICLPPQGLLPLERVGLRAVEEKAGHGNDSYTRDTGLGAFVCRAILKDAGAVGILAGGYAAQLLVQCHELPALERGLRLIVGAVGVHLDARVDEAREACGVAHDERGVAHRGRQRLAAWSYLRLLQALVRQARSNDSLLEHTGHGATVLRELRRLVAPHCQLHLEHHDVVRAMVRQQHAA